MATTTARRITQEDMTAFERLVGPGGRLAPNVRVGAPLGSRPGTTRRIGFQADGTAVLLTRLAPVND